MMTADEISARTARAVAAAADAGRALGLDVREPVVLHDAFSVVAHLAPAPVAARVPLVLPPALHGAALAARQQRELDVVAWLAERGVPVVPPSPLVGHAPVARDGFSITFWELADLAADHAAYVPVDAGLVVGLHEALREYPGADDLAFLAPVNHTVPSLLERLDGLPDLMAPADLERARHEWEMLAPVLGSRAGFARRFPGTAVQTVHGDGPSYNVIRTTAGVRFADFEDVALAPPEWDLALAPPEDVERYTAEAARRGLPAPDAEVLRVMGAARMLQLVASMALVPELPVLGEWLPAQLETWRGTPLAGGLA